MSTLLESLTEEVREVIRLSYVAHLSFFETANMPGRKEDAVSEG
jgi:DNA-directed RNA polymerase specialized sigma24 family protein